MMLTIHGLPSNTSYPNLKGIIKTECKITEFILGVFAFDDDGTKKVRIGVADVKAGNIVIKCLDGYKISGHVLRVVPIGKANIINENAYEWRGTEQGSNYENHAIEPVPSHSAQWSNVQGTPQWTSNQQTISPQVQNQSNFGYTQQGSAVQPSYYQQPYNTNRDRTQVLTNVEILEYTPSRVQSGRYPTQDYNPKVTGNKEDFQGTSQYNASNQFNQPQYQDQGYNTQWSTYKTFTLSEKQSYDSNMIPSDKRPIHDQGKGPRDWNQYEKVRRSPHRDRSLPERRSPPGHRVSPSGHRILPSGRRISPHRRNLAPGPNVPQSGRRVSPPGRRISPPGRRNSPPARRFSPARDLQHGRDISAPVRRISPPARVISPAGRQMPRPVRAVSPAGRKISPSVRNVPQAGRGMGPANQGISASGRMVSPSGHRLQQTGRGTDHRMSSDGRKVSPGHKGQRLSPRRMSPGKPHRDLAGRLSPTRGPAQREYTRFSSPHTNNTRAIPIKDVRPAYDPPPQAQSQPMYSGGFSQHARENVQFSSTAPRSSDQRPIWQDREKAYNTSKPIDDRGIVSRNQKFDTPRELDYQRGINQPEGKLHSPGRMSRSPNRRERSPIRDRFRRHSPSPRSPRRSWALEKRQSPENHETLNPVWQPKESPYAMQNRPNDERITEPVWEKPYEQKNSPVVSRKENRPSQDHGGSRYYGSPPRTRWSPKVALPTEHRDSPLTQPRAEDRFTIQREQPQFAPREEFSRHVPEGGGPRQDRRDYRNFMQDHKTENYRQRFDAGKPDIDLGPDHLEIVDVFKRAAELAKKTEEHRNKKRSEKPYPKEHESLRDEERETKSYQQDVSKRDRDDLRSIRPNQHPYQASSSHRGSGHTRDYRNVDLSPTIQYKRDKAVDELAGKLLLRYAPDIKGKDRDQVEDRLKNIIDSIIFDMFGDKDVSFIEIIIKFEDRHHSTELKKIVQRAISVEPIESRPLKRPASDESYVSAKISRDSPSTDVNRDQSHLNANRRFDSSVEPMQPQLVPKTPFIAQLPSMAPFIQSAVPTQVYFDHSQDQDGYYLFLCKNNFQPFSDDQLSLLKNFIFNKIADATELTANWSPVFTLREVQNEMRLEVWTRDELSKNWLINLDFNEFPYFSVLTYTAEELWYKRAAIWLPGHLKKKILSPIAKLKLQNRHLTGVNIDKWKLVKEIIMEKGTRLYVDLPPSCATALEAYDMLLSYELQKVHVFLKSVAIDKNAFDAGLEEKSVMVISDLQKQNAHMPAINLQDPKVMKFCLSGKTISLNIARIIKETLISHIFKYLQEDGRNKMDFLKYGFTKPGYFCVVPENEETGKWLSSVNLGQINCQHVTVSGAYCEDTRFFAVYMSLPYEKDLNPKRVLQNIKSSNRGEKGLKCWTWKNGHVFPFNKGKRMNFQVNVDIESMETLINLNFVLDYFIDNRTETIEIIPEDSIENLKDIVTKWKAETKDSLDVTTMDISTDDDDVICLS